MHSSPLLDVLRAYVARSRWQALVRRSADAVAIAGWGLPLLCLIDAIATLPPVILEIGFDGIVAAVLLRLTPALARLVSKRIDLSQAAIQLERSAPWLNQRLSTLLSHPDDGSSLALHLHAETLAGMRACPDLVRSSLPWDRGWKRLLIAIAVSAVLFCFEHRFGCALWRVLPPWS